VSKYLKQKPQQFIEQYLRIDEDQDYVLQSVPCNFLDNENACMIYEVRPKACREFSTLIERNFNKFQTLL
jgi:Fe-S-cluster containining protein